MDGAPFLIAGYAVTWAALAWYVWRLERRARGARRALDSISRHAGGDDVSGAVR